MVAVIGGFLTAANGNRRSLDDATAGCIREDGNFSAAAEVPDKVLGDIEKSGVAIAPQDYFEYEYDQLFTLRIFANRIQFNLPKIHDGKLPDGLHEIALDWLYAKNNNLNIGGYFAISGQRFEIVGLIWVPDYTSPYKNNSDMIMDAAHFGVALVSASAFDSFPKERITKSYAYRFTERQLSKSERFDVSAGIRSQLVTNGVPLTSFVTADENQAIAFVYGDFGSDVPMMKGFLFVMIAILAFIFAIIIDHTIASDAGAIGALSATGMRRGELIRHYLTLPLIVTLMSAVIGGAVCLAGSYRFFNTMYHTAYSLPPLKTLFDWEALLYTTLLPIAVMLMINLFFLWRRLSIMPIRFLRGELQSGKSKRAFRLPDFAFAQRFRLRIILSNKGSYAMLLLGILFANFILMMGLVLKPSINGYIDTIEREAVSGYQYILKSPASPPESEQKDAEKFSVHATEYYDKGAGRSFEVSMLGVSAHSKYLPGLALPSDGVMVSESLWKKYKLRDGDAIDLTDCATNKSYTVVVRGSTPYAAGFAVFMPIDRMNALAENPDGYWNGWFSNTSLTIDENFVATVITPDILRGTGQQMLTTFAEMMNICLLAAVVVYLVLFILLTKLVVDKNAHNISLMKILGYKSKELRSLFLSTTTAVVAFSLVVTLPLVTAGISLMYRELMFRKMSGYMDILTPWWVYTAMMALGFVSYFAINLLNVRRIKHIPMERALKVKE
ncbi:MAG: ABC transporter permease [Firmicutes bacterium]|nr:ABC transporter permease [Bacillota bacterium]